jgi:hypothetical protein
VRSLADAFPDSGFPPIVAVKLGESYFVIDGHHRVALARRRGGELIDADITEFVAPVPLPPGADMVEVVLRQLERVFLQESGLAEARRDVRFAASRPAIYLELLENLQVHGYHLMREQDRVLSAAEIAAIGTTASTRPPSARSSANVSARTSVTPRMPISSSCSTAGVVTAFRPVGARRSRRPSTRSPRMSRRSAVPAWFAGGDEAGK